MKKNKPDMYYKVGNRFRIHGYNDKGRWVIKRWEDIPELDGFMEDFEGGSFKRVEWVFHFRPTNRDNLPSGLRNFEVRIQLPDGRNEFEVKKIAREVLTELCNEEMVDTSISSKVGKDTVEYSKDDKINWMVIDTIRPKYKYPRKQKWGEYLDI